MTNKFLLLVVFILFTNFLFGQGKDTINNKVKKQFDAVEERSKIKYRFIPMPSFDPSTKWGLAGIVMANYYANKLDSVSPPSMTGITGLGTTNGSWGVGAIQNFNFHEDKWRITARVFRMNTNQTFDLGPLGDVDAARALWIANATVRHQIFNRLYLGVGYNFRSIQYEGRDPESQLKLENAGYSDKAENHGLKYSLLFDTRDNIFYPYRGLYLEYTLGQYLDNSDTVDKDNYLENLIDLRYFVAINGNTEHVLAMHFFGRFLTSNATNENYSFYGRSGAMIQRGYEFGSFVDKNLITGEVEYRWETSLLKNRLGFIGFVNSGRVFGDYFDFGDAEWLPAVGAGVRYRFLEYERMNFKADVAFGKEGWTVYFGIREAF